MAKKGNRLREFEKTHRVLDISSAQASRKQKKKEKAEKAEAEITSADTQAGQSTAGRHINWVRLVGVAVIIVFAVMVSLSVKNIFDLKEEEAALQERNSELIHLKEDLLMTLDNVNSDEFIEEQARKELKLAKGNELIFYFPDDWEAKHE
jgi:cell division protein FtsB